MAADDEEIAALLEKDAEPPEDVEAKERRARRQQLLQNLPASSQRNFEDRRKREMEAGQDPYEIEFQRKRKLFDNLAKDMQAPTPMQEAQLRHHMEDNYARMRQVRKAIRAKPKRASGQRASTSRGGRGVYVVEDVTIPGDWFASGELEMMTRDTMGYHVLWTQPSPHTTTQALESVRVSITAAEKDGISEVVTGKARIEYRWNELDMAWQQAFFPHCARPSVCTWSMRASGECRKASLWIRRASCPRGLF